MTVPQLSLMTKNKKNLSFILYAVVLVGCSPTNLKWLVHVNFVHLASLSKRWHVRYTHVTLYVTPTLLQKLINNSWGKHKEKS